MVNVVLGLVEKDDKILLIQRERGDFVGLWGIPGGKVEECEHIDEAVKREMLEEIGINMKFEKLLGFCTEIMHDKESTTILQICELVMDENQEILNPEFEYKWFSKEEFKNSNCIIESDKIMINEFYYGKTNNYLKLDCYKDKEGNYFWS